MHVKSVLRIKIAPTASAVGASGLSVLFQFGDVSEIVGDNLSNFGVRITLFSC